MGVDAVGDVTAAYNSSHVLTITNWAASAASPTTTPIAVVGGMAYVNDIAVNASGDAVVAGTSIFDDGTPFPPAEVVVGYRHGFSGTFDLHRYTYADFYRRTRHGVGRLVGQIRKQIEVLIGDGFAEVECFL